MIPATETLEKTSVVHPPATAIRKLVRCFGLLERLMLPYFAPFGISGSQWWLLPNLHKSEAERRTGLRLNELSERLLVRPPSVTGAVDRLEKAGLVRRDGVPGDLRAKHVALTAAGRRSVEQILEQHPAKMAELLGGLDPAEQQELHRLLTKLGDHLERL